MIRRRPVPEGAVVLRVDWPVCQGRGICAAVLPEVIALDPWGFPILPERLDPEMIRRAREAASLCPHAALRVIAPAAAAGSGPATMGR